MKLNVKHISDFKQVPQNDIEAFVINPPDDFAIWMLTKMWGILSEFNSKML